MSNIVPHTFWDDIEGDLKYVIYSDTDSLYLTIPEIQKETTEEYVEASEEIAEEINNTIINYMDNKILPKMNCKGHNQTFFKTEIIMSSILMLDKKKKYCFKEIANEGKIHEEPIIRYTGISVVRTNTAKLTKDFIKEIVEELALNTEIKEKSSVKIKMQEIANKYHNCLTEAIEAYNFNDIGTPSKWGSNKYKKEPAGIIGMRLYNTIFKEEYFKENTSGMKIPIRIKNINGFLNKVKKLRNQNDFCIGITTLDKLNFLVIPIYHTKEMLHPIFEEFELEVPSDIMWDKLVDTTLTRIISCIKEANSIK